MPTLARQFSARIEARPLLVEAAIASDPSETDRWIVLVDSERYKITTEQISAETSNEPLPSRLRTSIAHELLHTLTLLDSDGPATPDLVAKQGESKNNYTRRLESETEALTPALLLADRVVDQLAACSQLQIEDVQRVRSAAGVSRQMLVSRLSLIPPTDWRRFGTGLQDFALGLIEKNAQGTYIFSPWPLFQNFENGLAPWFVRKLASGIKVPAQHVIPDEFFVLNGGDCLTAEIDGHTQEALFDYHKMRVRITIEKVNRDRNYPFLFCVKKLP